MLLFAMVSFSISAKNGCLDSLSRDDSGSSNNGEPGPSNFIGTVISATRVDLSWDYEGIMVTEFKIERSTDGVNFFQIDTIEVSLPYTYSDTTVTTATMTYYYRVRGYSDRNGNTNYSNMISVSLLLPTCTTNPATNITDSSAKLNGTVNPNGYPNGSSVIMRFQWGTTTSYGNNTSYQALGNGNTNIVVSDNINGLLSNTEYNFRVVGISASGTTYGNNQTFTTTEP